MNRSKFRTVCSAVLLVVICGVALVKITESHWFDPSLEGNTQRLQSVWAFQRRAAAANLAQFASEADRVAPALSGALRDPDLQVRVNALQSLKAMLQPAGSIRAGAGRCSPARSRFCHAPASRGTPEHDQGPQCRGGAGRGDR